MSPRAKAGALDSRPPWEAPHLGGPGILDTGKDRMSNAEITPLEVPRVAPQILHAHVENAWHFLAMCAGVATVLPE